MAGEEGSLFGIMAEFKEPHELLAAAKKAREEGFTVLEAYSPFPVHGLKEALGYHDRRVQATMLIGGIIGALTGFGMETYATTWHYPLNIGGRPYFSWPAYIVITFELMVLFSGISGLLAIIVFNGLPRPHHPVFGVDGFERATRDRFFLFIGASDPRFTPEGTRGFLRGLDSLEVVDVES